MRKFIGFISFVLALCVTVPAHAQRTDLNGSVSVVQGLVPQQRANTAATGPWIDLQNYSGAMCIVGGGINDQTSNYIVLQDSVVGSAVAAVDSVNVGPDSTTSSMGYKGRGRYIRLLLRASGNAADTGYIGGFCVRSGARSR